MQIVEHFLFNLSLLVVLLFFLGLWGRHSSDSTLKVLTKTYFITSISICFFFSYPINENVLLDLRLIPFIIGSLYAGMGIILGILAVIVRGFFGFDLGFILNALLYLTLAHISIKWAPKFLVLLPKQRILVAVYITLAIGILQGLALDFITQEHPWGAYTAYLFIQPIGVGLIAFFLEELCKSNKFKNHKVETKRLEAVEQMGAAISHEIRNPLTAALGFVQLLENDQLNEEERELYLSILKQELHSAENVIQDYLTFSDPNIEKEKFDLIQEVTNVVHSLKPHAQKNEIRIITVLPKNVIIEGDRQKLRQCLMNIMKNALEAMENGGLLKVKVILHYSTVTIRIKDTGPGMTKEQIERIGEPYYSTKGDRGTGLGLMVVFSIIRAMNGTIHAESEVGKGTVFEISLPTIPSDIEIRTMSNIYI
ncbi:ATP-binding protein [Chungangia koreensis]|uniref:ATP-binding protein n=1 Tax=Chungangia koreensis TaxID=752657 RepID=UPI00366CFB1D